MSKSIMLPALVVLLLVFSPSLARHLTEDSLRIFTKIQADNKVEIKNCSTPDDATRMQLMSYTISPDTAKRGETVSFEVNFNLKENVTSGHINIEAKLDGKTLLNEKYSLCDIAKEANIQCPLMTGPLKIKSQVKIPLITPAGTYTAHATVTDQNDKELGCFDASVKMPL